MLEKSGVRKACGPYETFAIVGRAALWALSVPLRALRAWRKAIKEADDKDVDPW